MEKVVADFKGYGTLPDNIWDWYQLRLKHNDGGRYDKAPSTHAHLEILRTYAKECDYITEFGVRYVVSTWAFLAGLPKKMVSVDFRQCPVDEVHKAAEKAGIDYQFICADDLTIDIEETDLLFIDTLHTYDHLSAELKRHSKNVRKYIILHDTAKPEMNRAMIDFVSENDNWLIHEVYSNSYGMTILKNATI